jgi:hypothetical protein
VLAFQEAEQQACHVDAEHRADHDDPGEGHDRAQCPLGGRDIKDEDYCDADRRCHPALIFSPAKKAS